MKSTHNLFWSNTLGKYLLEIPLEDAISMCQDVQVYWKGPISGHWHTGLHPDMYKQIGERGGSVATVIERNVQWANVQWAVEVAPPKPEYEVPT